MHELKESGDESFSVEDSELPDIPSEETDFSSTNFGSNDENSSEDEESSDGSLFGSEETSFTSEEPNETSEFGSTDFSSSDFSLNETSTEDSFTNNESSLFSDNTSESSEDSTPFDFGAEETTITKAESPEPAIEFTSESEPEIQPEPAPAFLKAPEPSYKTPENFEDLKKFAESTSISGMGVEGNPSFSVLLKNIRYIEDVNDILSLMKELSLINDPEEQIRQRLMRGHLLVPRISEYAAIFLAHKLRRFDIDIQVGLSDEIHPPKHQESPETGLVSKYSLYQNQTHHFHFDDPKLEISQIIVASSPNLEGHQVLKYLGVASEHKILDGHIVEDEDSEDIPRHYSELAQKLKAHALKSNANAVIGLNYQLTPLPSDYGTTGNKYRLSCTGNLVWVNKL